MAWCKCNTPCLRSLIFLWVAARKVRIWKHAFHFPFFEPDFKGVFLWSTLYCESENVFCKILKRKTTRNKLLGQTTVASQKAKKQQQKSLTTSTYVHVFSAKCACGVLFSGTCASALRIPQQKRRDCSYTICACVHCSVWNMKSVLSTSSGTYGSRKSQREKPN